LLYRGETSIEALIREELERRRIPYEQQVQVGRFSVDFLMCQAPVVIECDGEYWHRGSKAQARDEYKDRFLMGKGYQVFRFAEREIRESPSACVERVLRDVPELNS
jgi:very-short-patch-repair endonuclease